jgi:signal transduction histidine kinase
MEDEVARQELAAAEKALAAGHFDAAQHLLDNAAQNGATPRHIQDLHRRIRTARVQHEFAIQNSVYQSFGVGIVCYLLLSIRQPLGWGIGLWLLLSVAAIPVVIGTFVGWKYRNAPRVFRAAFMDGFKPACAAMLCYSGFSLGVLLTHLQTRPGQIGEEFVAAMFTICLLSAAASTVAGVTCGTLAQIARRKGQQAA